MDRDPISNQLNDYKKTHKAYSDRAVNEFGIPHSSLTEVQSVGKKGSILLEDVNLIQRLSNFNRERVPERYVHAKGGGAYGYLEITHDITKYSRASVFEKIGKITPMFARLSTAFGGLGSADTSRDNRGFALKFYTDDGNWDVVGLQSPVYFVRDPVLFPNLVHVVKKNPDLTMTWDFYSLRPETTHNLCFLFSDRGTPDGYRHVNGYGPSTFKLVNADNKAVYCKFHFKTNQGIKSLTDEESIKLSGSQPDYAVRDLYNAIEEGRYPSWTMYIQVMTFEEAEKYRWDPFDATKVWPQADFPLIPVGKMTLNRNPSNFFDEVEQSGFNPGNMPPGIEASPDRILQARLISYFQTQLHRIGSNHEQLPVNRPAVTPHNYDRDGPMCYLNKGGAPNFFPNTFNGPYEDSNSAQSTFSLSGDVKRDDIGEVDNFSQPKLFYNNVISENDRETLAINIANSLTTVVKKVQDRAIGNFANVSRVLADRIRKRILENQEKENNKHN